MTDFAVSLPRHIAFIMDGNGRWATGRSLPRAEGHRRGAQSVRRVVDWAVERGVECVTFYAFSTENWKRPEAEIGALMDLLRHYFTREIKALQKKGVRVRIIGNRDENSPVPADIRKILEKAEEDTAKGTGLTAVFAFNYGARDEIVRAARRAGEAMAAGDLPPESLDEATFADFLDTHGLPEVDLCIRTSGEQRLSNFLLWQLAYAEFAFVPESWPEVDAALLDKIMADFTTRHRRFGAVA